MTKTYRDGEAETRVLDRATLELHRGETTSLTGVSGSGKTTLLGVIAGLLRPSSGRVAFDGRDLATMDDAARAALRAQRIGLVLQSGNLIPFLSAIENVELAIELAHGTARRDRAVQLLEELGLGRRMHHRPHQLSGGEAQRASVAMALANEPDLLLADEVTGELDTSSAEAVMDVVLGAWRRRGLTVLFVTHSSDLAARAIRRLRLSGGVVEAA